MCHYNINKTWINDWFVTRKWFPSILQEIMPLKMTPSCLSRDAVPSCISMSLSFYLSVLESYPSKSIQELFLSVQWFPSSKQPFLLVWVYLLWFIELIFLCYLNNANMAVSWHSLILAFPTFSAIAAHFSVCVCFSFTNTRYSLKIFSLYPIPFLAIT